MDSIIRDLLNIRLVLTFSADAVPVIAEVDPDVYLMDDGDIWINNSFASGNHPLSDSFSKHIDLFNYTGAPPSSPVVWIYNGLSYRREKDVVLKEIKQIYLENLTEEYKALALDDEEIPFIVDLSPNKTQIDINKRVG